MNNYKNNQVMKQNFKYALMGAIALTGASFFSACSSNEEIIDNPDYNPETKSVKTTISLSVNPANANANSSTRQAEAIAQVGTSPVFRGITNMLLIPSSSAISASTETSSKIELEDYTFDPSTNHKLYANKDVSVGVSNFLFLGKAKDNAATSSSDINTKLASGYTTNNFASAATVGAIAVSPAAIATTSGDWATQSAALAAYLKTIADATGWAENANVSLNGMHAKFTRTTITAGSASAVLLTLQDLYKKINGLDASTETNIRGAIAAQVDVNGTVADNNLSLAWKNTCTFKDFPASLGLPEGSAQYKYNTTNSSFEYVTDNTNATTTAVSDFVYPNELYYLTSTPIKVSSTKTETWPTTSADWMNSEWTSWTDVVDGNTKNIALKYNVQYGSALLATQVKCAATTLYDNAKQLDPDNPGANKAIDVSTNHFQLTGVIVGGQPSSVGWNFLPSTGIFNKAIYDPMTPTDVTTSNTAANYTLVFDDRRAEKSDVNICLEFLNNSGQDFYGKDGVILNGQKFYLIGRLNVTSQTTDPFSSIGTDDAEDSFIPSRDLRAFIQDFTTTAQFVITAGSADGTIAGSLTKAMSTIPDLRASSQTIGLSVDLTWRTGITYSSNLGE